MSRSATAAQDAPPGTALEHLALVYDGEDDYVSGVGRFVQEGLDRGEPAFVSVPTARLRLIRGALDRGDGRIVFADMREVGANPARIMPAIGRFVDAHAGRPVRFVGEPIWPDRCPCELREATRHEALINLAFAGAPVRILCPYDASALSPDVLADAEITHPLMVRGDEVSASSVYVAPWALPRSCDGPLDPPPGRAEAIAYADSRDLGVLRARVSAHAARRGLPDDRVEGLRLAVSEVATNSLLHGPGRGVLRMWSADGRVVCQLEDGGDITDPLAGRRGAAAEAVGGWGLMIANQFCDLVEIRSGEAGTTIRLSSRIAGG